MSGLCTLEDVKTLLQIPAASTSFDSILNLLIRSVSAQIQSYCNRVFGVDDYTDNLAPSGGQVLQLLNFPINTVTSVTVGGSLLDSGNYFLYSQYKAAGQIYKPDGWYGPMAVRGLTGDPFAPLIEIVVVYNAGFVLPGDDPITGVADLPEDIQLAAMQMVAWKFGLANTANLGENLSGYKEGQIAYQWDNPAKIPSDLFGVTSGMPIQFASLLNPYRRWAAA